MEKNGKTYWIFWGIRWGKKENSRKVFNFWWTNIWRVWRVYTVTSTEENKFIIELSKKDLRSVMSERDYLWWKEKQEELQAVALKEMELIKWEKKLARDNNLMNNITWWEIKKNKWMKEYVKLYSALHF